MTTTTATKPAKGKTPKPAPAPEVKPEAPKAAPTNSAYADEATRAKVTQAMADLNERGFTRPQLAEAMGMTLGAVWRAQNDKVHTAEVATIEALIKKVLDGELQPTTRARKPKAEDLAAQIDRATEVLKAHDAAKTVTQLRKLVAEALAALNSPVA
jgi:transcriptional regulator with XRE-family HTH domain